MSDQRSDPLSFASSLERARLDQANLGALIVQYRNPLLARIRLMMGERARQHVESVDVLQATIAEVVANHERYDIPDENRFLRWAVEVARNNIRDGERKRRERAFANFSSGFGEVGSPNSRSTPSGKAVRNEAQHLVAEAIESLDTEMGSVVELRNIEGLPFKEIGKRMGRSENAVQLLHARALIRLGKKLKGYQQNQDVD
ncbi:MAG: sigma-70 family RNA polymerase sigma factor [bacterium]|nr:sigma-70 family RNA polymerase sigma factor [bacterium]